MSDENEKVQGGGTEDFEGHKLPDTEDFEGHKLPDTEDFEGHMLEVDQKVEL